MGVGEREASTRSPTRAKEVVLAHDIHHIPIPKQTNEPKKSNHMLVAA